MNNDISNTIDVLTARVRAKEDEANKLKRLVNELCAEVGIQILFPGVSDQSAATGPIRSDEYYGQTLTAAIRNYLERRKTAGSGAASVSEIFSAIKEGGYKFESRNDENAKTSVGNALRKTSSIFHRLPNGNFGLLIWYPGAKAKPEDESPIKKRATKAKPSKREQSIPDAQSGQIRVTNAEIRDIVLAQQGEFKTSEIVAAVKAKYPTKELPEPKAPQMIFNLRKKGFLKEVSPRNGTTQAVYAKS